MAAFVRIHDAALCCSWQCDASSNKALDERICHGHGTEIGVLGGADRSDVLGAKAFAPSPTVCERACATSGRCRHFSHSVRHNRCVFCTSCELSTANGGSSYTSWSKRPGAGRGDRFDRTPAVTRSILEPLLNETYRRELYGAHALVPFDSLRIVWLSLLPKRALKRIWSAAAVCKWESKPPLHPFYAVHDMHVNPPNAMWVHSASAFERAPILPSHSWVEVVHCPNVDLHARARRGKAAPWKYLPSWFWRAPGSGVSINLGKTMAVPTWDDAARLLLSISGNATRPPSHHSRRPPSGGGSVSASSSSSSSPSPSCDDGSPQLSARHDLPDSIQIVRPRQEYFSREPRHEVLWLKQHECVALRHDTPGVRCGRAPHLFDCPPDHPVLGFMANCRPSTKAEFGPRVRSAFGSRGALGRYQPSSPCSGSPCYRGVSEHEYQCPVER